MAFASNNQPSGGRHFSGAHAANKPQQRKRRRQAAEPAEHASSAEARQHAARAGHADQSGSRAARATRMRRAAGPADTTSFSAVDATSDDLRSDPLYEGAPQPIDPNATDSFGTIDADEGAIMGEDAVQTDEEPEDDNAPGHGFMIILAIAIAAVVGGMFYLFASSCSSQQTQQQDQTQQQTEQTQASADSSIEYRGVTYYLTQNDQGKYSLIQQNQSDGTQTVDLGEVDGTPAKLVLYNATLIVPETKSDGTWDVMAYTIGSGWGQICDQSGTAYSGQGTISDAQLDGSNLNLTVNGSQVVVPLEW